MAQTTLKLEGLTCQGCVGSVTTQLQSLPGVTDVDIDLVNDGVSTATVTSNPTPSAQQLSDAVAEAGYTVVE
ncbi:MAG: heavy-metal-associated domain-containing protein [Yaniella sp.]|uniref:heavy-metal-associated domain-containing protein n=1 Tax=Yaniella sp. TaxID=2773929 RepID=UPI00264A3770|nr:heavy-metal-associated domain-containing protein [Yaniella sp.]MDN5703941.1 heavy-metal-associated domain-containing protein [Yaniella sp.]MDN5731972.1 heavy-metal-associated domain-containing protein [Yaniella sp.]MDN5741911.1 heavy-metal-associated domain-containing protein [Yaniella sp.]MDN5815188.1 heavy-metal-associated domain-containing protein [Yaniella sp.]MDN5817901.1 heavy-metal-associated domain-containing protein [Yaniella sp.]